MVFFLETDVEMDVQALEMVYGDVNILPTALLVVCLHAIAMDAEDIELQKK